MGHAVGGKYSHSHALSQFREAEDSTQAFFDFLKKWQMKKSEAELLWVKRVLGDTAATRTLDTDLNKPRTKNHGTVGKFK